jgi:zinc/manganese transport system permease protein
VIISRNDTYAGDLTAVLFGDILGVRNTDLLIGVVALAITMIGLALGHRSFVALSLSRDKAAALGLRPGLAHAVMLTVLALAVVASFRLVGTLLVFGFLVAPPATAVLVAKRLVPTMALAVVFAWIAVVVGLTVSYHAETAASATVAGIAVAQFFVVAAATEIAARLPHPASR